MTFKYPVYSPSLSGNEKTYVNDCLNTNWISSKGKYVNQFEEKFSHFTGIKSSVAVCNGTVALHLALEALGIGIGDEVIVPTLTYIASVNAISYTGAKAVFVDSNKDTWQMEPSDVISKITDRTKAIICVHLYGQSCDMEELKKIKDNYKLYLIEDCAEAIGTLYNNKHVGNFGDISTFSFYGNKTITTGEGGMVSTNNNDLYEKVLRMKCQGLAKDREYWHDLIGYNYRMTNICAAIGLAQMENIVSILTKKKNIANWYRDLFEDTEFQFHKQSKFTLHSYWMCTILIPEKTNRKEFRIYLAENGIETRPMFYPIHTMPIYKSINERHPVAESLSLRGLNLPSYPDLTHKDIKFIADKIIKFRI
jgi:perosamine synthetase